jgi:hypothetical protein
MSGFYSPQRFKMPAPAFTEAGFLLSISIRDEFGGKAS